MTAWVELDEGSRRGPLWRRLLGPGVPLLVPVQSRRPVLCSPVAHARAQLGAAPRLAYVLDFARLAPAHQQALCEALAAEAHESPAAVAEHVKREGGVMVLAESVVRLVERGQA